MPGLLLSGAIPSLALGPGWGAGTAGQWFGGLLVLSSVPASGRYSALAVYVCFMYTHVCMDVCVYLYLYTCACIFVWERVHTCTHTGTSVCVRIGGCAHVYGCACVWTCVPIHVLLRTCVHVHMVLCTCMCV